MKRSFLMLFVAVLSASIPAFATRVRRLSLEELRDRAESVIVAEVVGTSTRVGQANMVWTDYQVRVVDTIKGSMQPAITTLSFAGGRSGELNAGIDGVPVLQRGATYVFFLEKNPTGLLAVPTLGWGQGIYKQDEIEINGVKKPLLVSPDGEPLEVDASGNLVRGRRLDVSNGVHEMKVAQSSNRVEFDSLVSANGTVTPLAPSPSRDAAAIVSPRRPASLSQLRDFMAGRLADGERNQNAH